MPLLDMPLKELYEYKGISPMPEDFDEFWDGNLKALNDIDPQVEVIESNFKNPIARCYDLYFTSLDGARIYAKFIKPKNITGTMPVLLEFHGYQGSSGDWSNKLHYAASGMCVVAMDCRGQAGFSEDVGGVKGITVKGHIVRGLSEGKNKLLFKSIFLDTVMLTRIIMDMDFIDENKVMVTGGSQGGALALACAALEPRIKSVFAFYPFLCDYKRVWEMDLGGEAYDELRRYFKFIDPLHENEEYIFSTLGYIDIKNLVHRIKCEVNMAIGLMDDVCPPSTQFATYNNINTKKNLLIYPEYGHEGYLPKLSDKIYQWAIKI